MFVTAIMYFCASRFERDKGVFSCYLDWSRKHFLMENVFFPHLKLQTVTWCLRRLVYEQAC